MTTSRILHLALLFMLLLIESASAQRVWTRGNTFGHVTGLSSVYMRDSLDGWAVGSQGRILRTSDAGENWIDESLDSNYQFNDVTFVDEKNGVIVGGLMWPNHWWEPIVFRTRDGGRSWKRSIAGEVGSQGVVEKVIVSGSRMAAVAPPFLMVSRDSGATWKSIYFPFGPFSPVIWDLFVTPGGDLFVFASDGFIYRASEDGIEWPYVGGNRTGYSGWEYSAVGIPTPAVMMMLDRSGSIHRSTDTGATWSIVARTEREDIPEYTYWAGSRFHFPDAANGLLVTPNGIMYTTADTGATWARSPAAIPRRISRSHFSSRDTGFAVTAHRIYKTNDGGRTWVPKSRAYGIDFRGIAGSRPEYWFGVGAKGAVAFSYNGGEDWQWNYSDTRRTLNDISICGDDWDAYIVGDSGTVLRPTEESSTWRSLSSPLPNWNLLAVETVDDKSAIAAGYDNRTKNGIIVSTADSGKSWKIVEPPNTARLRDLSFVDAIVGYAVGDSGAVLSTRDSGATWTPRPVALPGSAQWSFSSVHFIDRENGMIVGRSSVGGVTLHTTNGGLFWQVVDGPTAGLEHKAVRMQSPTAATVLTSTGTITTSNGGATWQQEQMLEGEVLSGMDFVSTGRGVIVGLNGAVYWSGSIVSGVEEERRVMPWEKLQGPMLH